MYLFIAALLEIFFFVKCIHPLVTIVILLVYSLWYFDGKEYTGERRWEGFRTLRVWRHLSPIEYTFPSERTDLWNCIGKRLFVVTPARTPYPLIWGIGLHGGQLHFERPTHYMLPPPYLWVPFLRDILMWSGAVTYSMYNEDKSQKAVLFRLLDGGRAICYSPYVTRQHHVSDVENGIPPGAPPQGGLPTEGLLQFAIENKIDVIPVVVQHEKERYRIIQLPVWAAPLQELALKYTDYAFPLCYWFRWYSSTRPPPVGVQFGPIMSSERFTSAEKLAQCMAENIKQINDSTPLPTASIIAAIKKRQSKPAD